MLTESPWFLTVSENLPYGFHTLSIRIPYMGFWGFWQQKGQGFSLALSNSDNIFLVRLMVFTFNRRPDFLIREVEQYRQQCQH